MRVQAQVLVAPGELELRTIDVPSPGLTNYLVTEVQARGCRVESPRGDAEWSGIVLFAPPRGGPSAADLVAAMHTRRISINAREGCVHMGIHFYNTREDIDRVLQVIDESTGRQKSARPPQ